jgi:hypothetical protein
MHLINKYAPVFFLSFFAGALLVIAGCDDSNPVREAQDGPAPEPVSNVQVNNVPGGAELTYDLPSDQNLAYVEATFDLGEGNKVQTKSSDYDNKLMVEGFPESGKYTGSLYAVSRGGKKSEAVEVSVSPKQPAYKTVAKQTKMEPTFGGVSVQFEGNESQEELVFTVLTEDSVGTDMIEADRFYTSAKEGRFAIRGYDAEERDFSVFVRDQFEHISDTSHTTLTPLYEVKIPREMYEKVDLPTDTNGDDLKYCGPWCTGPKGIAHLWDGVTGIIGPIYHSASGEPAPLWFTIDLGVKTRLSRFKMWSRDVNGTNGYYRGGDPRVLELWGSNDPASDGSWDSWTKLGQFESTQASGPPLDEITGADRQRAVVNGQDFVVPSPSEYEPFRYVRVKVAETWNPGSGFVFLAELRFFGSPVEPVESE